MKKLINMIAGIGLLLTGVAAVPAAAVAQRGPHVEHRDRADDRRGEFRDDRRYRDDGRRFSDRRDRRYRADRRYDRHDRRYRDDRRYRGERYGQRGDRIIHGGSREAAARGVEYRGPCRYIIRNGRRVCG
jgi:hypothetical protein